MKPVQAACFALLASAFVLAAILIVGIDQKSQDNTVNANGQNIVDNNFQLMTAQTRGVEESLFVLSGNVIVVYTPDVGQQELEPKAVIRMADLFGGGGGGGGR